MKNQTLINELCRLAEAALDAGDVEKADDILTAHRLSLQFAIRPNRRALFQLRGKIAEINEIIGKLDGHPQIMICPDEFDSSRDLTNE